MQVRGARDVNGSRARAVSNNNLRLTSDIGEQGDVVGDA